MTGVKLLPGRLIDVGGYRLHLNCTGGGSPTILLDAGLGDSCMVWADIQPILAQTSRVCSYDRAGIGWSEPGTKPRSFQKAAEELHCLLVTAHEMAPYILVGHSAGVNTIRLFAHSYPSEVAGLVLIEPPILDRASPVLFSMLKFLRKGLALLAKGGAIRYLGKTSRMSLLFAGASPPKQVAENANFLYRPEVIRTSVDEIDGLPETIRHLGNAKHAGAWRDWPVVVISAYQRAPRKEAEITPLRSLANLSSRGEILQVKSSHFVHFDQPGIVVRCIISIVNELRNQS